MTQKTVDIFSYMDEPQAVEEPAKKGKTKKAAGPKKPGLFDFVKQINMKGKGLKFDPKAVSPYMLVSEYGRYNDTIDTANDLNMILFDLPKGIAPELAYKYFFDTVPRGPRFKKWPKKTKADAKLEKQIEQLVEEHGMSRREAMATIIK